MQERGINCKTVIGETEKRFISDLCGEQLGHPCSLWIHKIDENFQMW